LNCPYCKIDLSGPYACTKNVVCQNCRNYADAAEMDRQAEEERTLFAQYKWIPINWRDWNKWRTDPYYLRT